MAELGMPHCRQTRADAALASFGANEFCLRYMYMYVRNCDMRLLGGADAG